MSRNQALNLAVAALLFLISLGLFVMAVAR